MEKYIKKYVEDLIHDLYYTYMQEYNIKLDVVVNYDKDKDDLRIFIIDDCHRTSRVILITKFISVYVLCGGMNVWHEDIDTKVRKEIRNIFKERCH